MPFVIALLLVATLVAPAAAQAPASSSPRSDADQATAAESSSEQSAPKRPWLLVPLVSSSPKLGTSGGVFGGYLKVFDPVSRVSIFGAIYQYSSSDSSIGSVFARTSFGADHHRIVGIVALGYIKNDYQDYLGTGEPLQTDDDLQAAIGRYVYRAGADWFVGAQGMATNYQVLGATPEDDLVLETLGVRGISSAALGAVVMHDSRDNDDMPRRGWFLNVNNLAYREAFGGSSSFDAYRADFKGFLPHGNGHVLAVRQYNWLTSDSPLITQATVILRGYKLGQYLAPYMSSLEVEERLSFGRRWGATLFGGAAGLYGQSSEAVPRKRDIYPTWGAGLQFVVKPDQRMLANFEYAQGVEDNRGLYLKFGYGW